VPAPNSYIIEINYTSSDPELAARQVNILAREYIEYSLQAKYDSTNRATEFLQKQLVDLKAKVQETEEAQLRYARAHNILNVNEKQDVVLQTLADLNRELTEARSARMLRIPVKPATESGGNRPGRSEATLEVDNHVPGGRFESIPMTLIG